MADIAKHAPVGISVGGSAISAIEPGSVNVSPAVMALLERGGELKPQVGMTLASEPTITFQTSKINLLAAAAAISASPVILYFRAFADDGGMGAGYITLTIAKGLIVPETLAAKAKEKALLSCKIFPVSSDGDAAAIAVGSTGATLTATADIWTVGGATVGTALSGVQDVEVQWGYNVVTNAGENGKVFPTEAYVDAEEARIMVTTAQLSAAVQNSLAFGLSSATVSAVFRKLASGAVPSGTYTATLAKALATLESVAGRPALVKINCGGVQATTYLSFA